MLAIAQVMLTGAIGILAGVIAFQQWKLARDKFALDLFDRRMKIYEELRKALGFVMTTGRAEDRMMLEFLQATWEADFLFGKDVTEYNRKFYENGIRLSLLGKQYSLGIKGGVPNYDNDKIVEEDSKLLKWFSGQYEPAQKLYGRYMKIDRAR